MQNYRQLSVWRKAHAVALNVHRTAESIPRGNNAGVGSQMARAAVSIAANIVEGSSRGTDQDFAKFLQIAIGSASELEYHLHFAADAGLISQEEFAARAAEVVEVRKMLIGLRKKLVSPKP
ncbi:MAG: four helix bundle protein [Gemmatimonadaceae bacterium]